MATETHRNHLTRIPWAHFRLRPFSQIALRVMHLANREDVPLHILAGLISTDPAFAGEVLTVANSPLFAPRTPASSVMQAAARLGTRNLQGLCLTVAVRAYLGERLNQPVTRAIWRHNLACAVIAEKIAAFCNLDKDIAFTSGVMHDIGRLALLMIEPGQYTALLKSHVGDADTLLEREKEQFGMDHCQAGRKMIMEWRLPPSFEAVVADHHAAAGSGHSWEMTRLIHLSCRLADSTGFAAFSGCRASPFETLLAELPEGEKTSCCATQECLAEEVQQRISAVETA